MVDSQCVFVNIRFLYFHFLLIALLYSASLFAILFFLLLILLHYEGFTMVQAQLRPCLSCLRRRCSKLVSTTLPIAIKTRALRGMNAAILKLMLPRLLPPSVMV